jgi:uncharacterized membrane protein
MNGSGNSTVIERDEARYEAAPIVLGVAGLQLLLALVSRSMGWDLWVLPWWSWFALIVPEVLLMVMLLRGKDPRELKLVGIIFVLNLVALVMLIGSILEGHEHDGKQLLFKGATVWATDVVTFCLAYWQIDRVDDEMFQWPSRQEDPKWDPHFFDYFYVSFTNSIAFSPTDAMPLTRRAKGLMFLESSVSAVAVLLVAARAVNILK